MFLCVLKSLCFISRSRYLTESYGASAGVIEQRIVEGTHTRGDIFKLKINVLSYEV